MNQKLPPITIKEEMTKYLVNQTQTSVGLFQGRYLVGVGSYQEVTNEEAATPEVAEAVRRKWLTISSTKPVEGPGLAAVEISEPPVKGSKTPPVKAKKEIA